ncbi:hypothetical protein ASPSYDRAFT_46207 [Aspergillus sydowii CBS 593.65]|uniref:Uncharacterized protein n=1 Tax=Aspergillus sydowii CBS 593.65 TaxID=1036612 RepID=A0A1L9TFL6_9EURO|nr:uncharacterized protein ASPSYDRAFT_46207 [Aspergillus sydowii CBS 593.65]OJJ58185.1 hypothetical protein ASPSYDRAFT_46207 [Aspergillus sydowii CBS 593.65]
MIHHASSLELDPTHTSCIGGKTVLTCRCCAGNAPRNSASICSSCRGRGITMFACSHCNPAAAANRPSASTASSVSTPESLSRSSSTSVSSYNDRLAPTSVQRFGDRDHGSAGGRVENNPRRT